MLMLQPMTTLHNPATAVAWLRDSGAQALTTDSRQVANLSSATGTAFIAWPGAAVDGRQFVPQALQSGAVAALVEHNGWLGETTGHTAQVGHVAHIAHVAAYPNLKTASGQIASLFYNEPSTQMSVVAFTGTNGKTSSSWWLAQAMDGAVVGTLGIGKIGSIVSTGLTTPDPIVLQDRLKSLLDKGCKVIALEASSIGIAEDRLNGTHIHTAVFTNFTQDHLDYHGSMEVYWQAKVALFDWPHLKAAVINIDDPQGMVLRDRLSGKALDVWTVAIEKSARLIAQNIQTTAMGLQFDVIEEGQSHPLQTCLVGHYNVSNLLGVIAAMRSLGLPLAACIAACQHITPVPGRLEVVTTAHSEPRQAQDETQGVHNVPNAHTSSPLQPLKPLIVVDYAHTPDALEKVLHAMREIATIRSGKLWCVFGCGGDRDAAKRPLMGATARAFADYVVITSDNPRSEVPATIVSHILLGLEEDTSVQVQIDRARAISETLVQAAARDVIVIAGKGHEDYQEVAGIKQPFSDQAHARAALAVWRAAA
jgi:UDP-N-acetylmuramyl-tripeptide synthetase